MVVEGMGGVTREIAQTRGVILKNQILSRLSLILVGGRNGLRGM